MVIIYVTDHDADNGRDNYCNADNHNGDDKHLMISGDDDDDYTDN